MVNIFTEQKEFKETQVYSESMKHGLKNEYRMNFTPQTSVEHIAVCLSSRCQVSL